MTVTILIVIAFGLGCVVGYCVAVAQVIANLP